MKTVLHKIGSIPFKVFNNKVAVLFVTSQARGRWILPKGELLDSESHEQACYRETYNECGAKGYMMKNFPITKPITKLTSNGLISNSVTFYPLVVEEQDSNWPDQNKRQRHWALLKDVNKVASREDYIYVLEDFKNLKPWKLV